MTENAVVRVMANPKYSRVRQFDIEEIVLALKMFRAATDHHFWPDEVSITDDRVFDMEKVHGPGQLTDAYLLALAVANGGRLVTFDRRISTSVVRSARNEDLLVVENR